MSKFTIGQNVMAMIPFAPGYKHFIVVKEPTESDPERYHLRSPRGGATYSIPECDIRLRTLDDCTPEEWDAASAATRKSHLRLVTAPDRTTRYVEPAAKQEDVVNDPKHYGGKDNPYEVIKVLQAWGLDEDAYLFNVVKYLARAGKKDPATDLQDHKKAQYYLNAKIAKMEKESK